MANERYSRKRPRQSGRNTLQYTILAVSALALIGLITIGNERIQDILGLPDLATALDQRDPEQLFVEELDNGKINIEAAKAISENDYRLIGIIDAQSSNKMIRPLGIECGGSSSPNWTNPNMYRFIVGSDHALREATTLEFRRDKVREYYGEAYNKEIVSHATYPHREKCKYKGMALKMLPPDRATEFGIMKRRDSQN
jgi:hypothetical protein